jgi:hypothetical protein
MVRQRTRGRRPTGGRDPVVNARMPRGLINAIDDWAAKHSDGSHSEAIRRLGCVDKLNPDADAGKQDEGGEALDQLVVAGGDAA